MQQEFRNISVQVIFHHHGFSCNDSNKLHVVLAKNSVRKDFFIVIKYLQGHETKICRQYFEFFFNGSWNLQLQQQLHHGSFCKLYLDFCAAADKLSAYVAC